ncbi:hypothetical protein [Polynucleobacter sp. UK-Gri1-W3]|uniref:hypothetical protein n=1 Tax=Polynucleobacter sp. UK-Gri1-W3 TaxID=1819737 RepID=UPI001C0A9D70|nr:hypothetical protein [Polynucleobacter sp. UK-Gri1-W3]MBU3538246.1 hypothetical protein [Polynucleobacter sp. UK-Gri1-W3]
MDAMELGVFFYLSTLSYLLNSILFVPVNYFLQSEFSKNEKININETKKILIYAFIFSVPIFLLISTPLIIFNKINILASVEIYIMACILFITSGLRDLLNNKGHNKINGFALLIEVILKIIIFYIICHFYSINAIGLIFSAIIAISIEMLALLWISKKIFTIEYRIAKNIDLSYLKSVFHLSIASISNLLQLQGYRIIYPLAGFQATSGVYGAVGNMGTSIMASFSSIYSQIELPKIYSTNGKYIINYIINSIVLIFIVIIFCIVLKDEIVLILGSNSYLSYSNLIFYGILTEGMNLVLGAGIVAMTIMGRTKNLSSYSVIAATISLLAGILISIYYPEKIFLIGLPIVLSQFLLIILLVINGKFKI